MQGWLGLAQRKEYRMGSIMKLSFKELVSDQRAEVMDQEPG